MAVINGILIGVAAGLLTTFIILLSLTLKRIKDVTFKIKFIIKAAVLRKLLTNSDMSPDDIHKSLIVKNEEEGVIT